jgi:DNA (cytosine-5)-methyltransferase 1
VETVGGSARATVAVKPRLLDLFCGAGGAAMGYHRAGFDVTGVDIAPQPRYPFTFVQADALEYLRGLSWVELMQYAAIHASPPCQRFSVATRTAHRASHPDLIAPTRTALRAAGLPWIMENVPGAPLENAYVLCGGGLGLGTADMHLQRHRLFECEGFEVGLVPPCSHYGRHAVGVIGHPAETTGRRTFGGKGGYEGSSIEAREAMGIDWMTRHELSQAIPPAMTELLGHALLASAAASVPLPEWAKALRAIVVAGELGCPSQGLALVARKALADCGVPVEGP